MLVVGLTGGIASGKTSVADLFAAEGIPVLDADRIAHELVEPGQAALEEIAATFGMEVMAPDGRLDRARLRAIVFADPAQRRRLEQILHPRIRDTMQERVRELDAPYCILVIPLLVETGQGDLVDRVLVIDAPERLQVGRASKRDGLPARDIEAVMRSQATREQRLAAADDVIINDEDPATLQERVRQLHARYLAMADHTPDH